MKVKKGRLKQDSVGFRAEEQACSYLRKRGYQIIGRNYQSRYGEIDIIAHYESVLVFVEVRYRKYGSLVTPAESVGPTKIRRLKLAIRDFLSRHEEGINHGGGIRVDLCCVTGLKNAFDEAHGFDFQMLEGIIQF